MKLFIVFARARFSPYSAPDNSNTYELSLKYFIVFSSFRIEGGKNIVTSFTFSYRDVRSACMSLNSLGKIVHLAPI